MNDDPEFVRMKRYGYSIAKLEARYPDGCPDKIIASALMIKEDEVEPRYDGVVVKMRGLMGVEDPS